MQHGTGPFGGPSPLRSAMGTARGCPDRESATEDARGRGDEPVVIGVLAGGPQAELAEPTADDAQLVAALRRRMLEEGWELAIVTLPCAVVVIPPHVLAQTVGHRARVSDYLEPGRTPGRRLSPRGAPASSRWRGWRGRRPW
jgi:hypothetical protein